MAKEYGRAPHEIAFGGGLSLMESQSFDLFVLCIGLDEEARLARRRK